jgi:hypothetical protein
MSSGKWEENKEKLSYDKMFHLFMLVRVLLNGGKEKVLKVEKNHVVEIVPASWMATEQTETMIVHTHSDMTLNKMFKDGIKSVGESKFWQYDARTQNCQVFIKALWGGHSSWNSKVESFVMQDAEKVLENLGVLGKVAKVVTDVAAVADVAMNGKGHRRGYGGRR